MSETKDLPLSEDLPEEDEDRTEGGVLYESFEDEVGEETED